MKLRLRVNDGTLAGCVYELEQGFLTIGRSPVCTVRLDPAAERIASKQHAFVESAQDGYYISDNSSLNGTLVNGRRVTREKLADGDVVQFGRNGVTAAISIDGYLKAAPTVSPPPGTDEFLASRAQPQAMPVRVSDSMVNFGLGPASGETPRPTRRYVGIGLTLFVVIFLSLVVMTIVLLSVGLVPAVAASVVAFVPAVVYVIPFAWLDRYDPEPLWLLALAFAWGALVAISASFFVNTAVGAIVALSIGGDEGAYFGTLASAVVSAPLFEEASKGFGLLVLLIAFRRYFDDMLDGIVFAGMIGLGFATVENVMYYGGALAESGWAALVVLFFLRGILSPFSHVTFTAMTGIGCGIARESHRTVTKILAPFVGYCAAVALHAVWNGLAFIGGFESFVVGYFFLEIPFFLMFVGFALFVMRRQNKILKEMLAIDVARDVIPRQHFHKATSTFGGTAWLMAGVMTGKFGVRRKYLRAIGKLGLSYWHIQRATEAQGKTDSFQQNPILRDEVLRLRATVD